jgi:hypothetical protein
MRQNTQASNQGSEEILKLTISGYHAIPTKILKIISHAIVPDKALKKFRNRGAATSLTHVLLS